MASHGRPDAASTEGSPARAQGLARSILVVDDDPGVLALVSRILRRAGGEVTTATSGGEALRLIAGGHVQAGLLLTDIDMPGMTGIELAARMVALRPGIRVVMMTGDPRSAEAARQHPDLVEAVLVKPITIEDVLAAVGWR